MFLHIFSSFFSLLQLFFNLCSLIFSIKIIIFDFTVFYESNCPLFFSIENYEQNVLNQLLCVSLCVCECVCVWCVFVRCLLVCKTEREKKNVFLWSDCLSMSQCRVRVVYLCETWCMCICDWCVCLCVSECFYLCVCAFSQLFLWHLNRLLFFSAINLFFGNFFLNCAGTLPVSGVKNAAPTPRVLIVAPTRSVV